jgi:hypothetical protein
VSGNYQNISSLIAAREIEDVKFLGAGELADGGPGVRMGR